MPPKPAEINHKVVEGMASVGATNNEIAEFLGVSEALIRKRCAQTLEKARASMRVKLRRAQMSLALGTKRRPGNPTLQIWLGKQILGQVDVQHIKVGDVKQLTDAELEALAAGRAPG